MGITCVSARLNGLRKVTQSVFSALTKDNIVSTLGYLITDSAKLQKQTEHTVHFVDASGNTVLADVTVPHLGRLTDATISSMASATSTNVWFCGDTIIGQLSGDITTYFNNADGITEETTFTLKSASFTVINFVDTYFNTATTRLVTLYGGKFTSAQIPKISHSGCTFSGWYTSATGGSKVSTSTTITATTTTYYARWTVNVTYDCGTVGGWYYYTTAAFVGNSLATRSADGYLFWGWYDDSGTKYTTVPTSDITLHAKWAWDIKSAITANGAQAVFLKDTNGYYGTYQIYYDGWTTVQNFTDSGYLQWYTDLNVVSKAYQYQSVVSWQTTKVCTFNLSTGELGDTESNFTTSRVGIAMLTQNYAHHYFQVGYKTTTSDADWYQVDVLNEYSSTKCIYIVPKSAALYINGTKMATSTVTIDSTTSAVSAINCIVLIFNGDDVESEDESGTWVYGKVNASGYTELGSFTRDDKVEIK